MKTLIAIAVSALLAIPTVGFAAPNSQKPALSDYTQLAYSGKHHRHSRHGYFQPHYFTHCRAYVNGYLRVGKVHYGKCRVYLRGYAVYTRHFQVVNRYGYWQWVNRYHTPQYQRGSRSGFSIWFSSGG